MAYYTQVRLSSKGVSKDNINDALHEFIEYYGIKINRNTNKAITDILQRLEEHEVAFIYVNEETMNIVDEIIEEVSDDDIATLEYDLWEYDYSDLDDDSDEETKPEIKLETKQVVSNIKENKKSNGGKSMFNNMFEGMEFGEVSLDEVRLTPAGTLAYNEGDNWFSYDKDKQQLVNNYELVLDLSAYKMPKTRDTLKVGDLICNKGKYSFIVNISKNELKVISKEGVVNKIKETSNIVGLQPIYTTIVPITELALNQVPATNEGDTSPISNMQMNPMLLMLMNKSGEDNSDMVKMMMLSGMLNQQPNANGMNPLMLSMLMGGNKTKGDKKESTSDMMKMMMLSNMASGNNTANSPLGINPMMLMLMSDEKDTNMKDMLMMMMLNNMNTQSAK